MPKKTKYTKSTVIEAGLDQLKEHGWEGITPKLVAKRLGSSTMPIFSHFTTMEELKKAVLDRAWEIFTEYTLENYTGDAWVDQAIGYISFARDHALLFNCMHYGKPEEIQKRKFAFWELVYKELEDYPPFQGLSSELIGWIRIIRGQLTHGIATSISTGFALVWTNEDVIRQMMPLCSEIICKGLSGKEDEIKQVSANLTPEERAKVNRGMINGSPDPDQQDK